MCDVRCALKLLIVGHKRPFLSRSPGRVGLHIGLGRLTHFHILREGYLFRVLRVPCFINIFPRRRLWPSPPIRRRRTRGARPAALPARPATPGRGYPARSEQQTNSLLLARGWRRLRSTNREPGRSYPKMPERKPEGHRVVRRSLSDAMLEYNARNNVQDPPHKTGMRDDAPNIHSQQPKSE